MANEYILSKHYTNEIGIIGLSKAVFESIAEVSVNELPQIKLAPNTQLNRNIVCKVVNNSIVLTIRALIEKGTNVNDLSTHLQEKITTSVKQMTDFSEVIVNVNIVGFFSR